MENHFKIAEEAKVWLNSFPSNDILFYGNLIWAIHHHPVGDDSQKFDDVLQQQRQRHQLGLNEQKRIFDEQMAEEKSKLDLPQKSVCLLVRRRANFGNDQFF